MLKQYRHAPTHILLDDHVYFLTGSIYHKKLLLENPTAKEIFLKYLFHYHEKFGWTIKEWAVLNNHYHFLSHVPIGGLIPKMINSLHRASAFYIMRELDIRVQPFWYQYWDRCIRNDDDYFKTACYILYNPVKHGLIGEKELGRYPYCSYSSHHGEDKNDWINRFDQFKPEDLKEFEKSDDF